MDKDLMILEVINNRKNFSQREIADHSGISLGSVNFLLKKMVKEGLVKIEQIPAQRLAYMITPKGILEKANKTYHYISQHYAYIEEQKKAMQMALLETIERYGQIQVLITDNEGPSEILKMAIQELELESKREILLFDELQRDKMDKERLLIVLKEMEQHQDFKVLNLLEVI